MPKATKSGLPKTSYQKDRPNKEAIARIIGVWVGNPTGKSRCAEQKRCKGERLTAKTKATKLIYLGDANKHMHTWICNMCARAVLSRYLMDLLRLSGQLTAALTQVNAESYTKHQESPQAENLKQHIEEESE